MFIKYKNLTIRNAEATDAELLCMWWNDGKIMAHAGLPNGAGCTPEEICKSLSNDTDETHRRHIIELYGKPIGEMNYRNKDGKHAGAVQKQLTDGCAEIGIKICDFSLHDKGYGTKLLEVFIDALFRYYGYEKIILNTNLNNKRAHHVYEKKLGFRNVGIEKNDWRDQLGELQSTINFEMDKTNWFISRKGHPEYFHCRHA